MRNLFFHIVFIALAFLCLSCQKDLPNQPKQNQLPTTRLWISSETSLNETVSRQHVYFYGEDVDGYITGFLVAVVEDSTSLFAHIPTPDTLKYFWTTKNDTLMPLPLYSVRSKFVIVVRAVDNHFSPSLLPIGAIVKGFPNPYWDRDSNGVSYLSELTQAVDLHGAIQRFPIRNTPPTVQFAVTPGDNPTTIEEPDTTFTAATFSWIGNDDDGNNTIAGYRIALNDTTDPLNWVDLKNSATTVTLYVKRQNSDAAGATVEAEIYTGVFGNLQYQKNIKNLKLNSTNVLYLRAKDVAGEYSPTVTMPSTSSKKWYVKKPQSRMLVVSDYGNSSQKNRIVSYYRNIFSDHDNTILNGQLSSFDVFDRANIPSILNPAFIKTLQLFDVVFWFTDRSPSLEAAQIGLYNYVNTLNSETNSYGKAIFTTEFKDFPINPSYSELRKYNDFAPLDSITTNLSYGYNSLPIKDAFTGINTVVTPLDAGYPSLFVDSLSVTADVVLPLTGSHSVVFKKLYKRTDSRYIYKIDSARVAQPPYNGQLEIGIIDNQKRFVMFGLPLHLLNGWEHNLPLFFRKVIEGEFGLQP
jgi:hypothetical protein